MVIKGQIQYSENKKKTHELFPLLTFINILIKVLSINDMLLICRNSAEMCQVCDASLVLNQHTVSWLAVVAFPHLSSGVRSSYTMDCCLVSASSRSIIWVRKAFRFLRRLCSSYGKQEWTNTMGEVIKIF